MDDPHLRSPDWEEYLPDDPQYRRLHRGVRLDPESVWEEVLSFLCAPPPSREGLDVQDLIEDLMFWHSDAFIDRLEALVDECPRLREDVAWSNVGGIAPGPGLERFYALQDRLASAREREGDSHAGSGPRRPRTPTTSPPSPERYHRE